MTEKTYQKAKAIMHEVEYLRSLKAFKYPAEAYSIHFYDNSRNGVSANATDIGTSGMNKIVKTYIAIIDDLILEKMKELEALK